MNTVQKVMPSLLLFFCLSSMALAQENKVSDYRRSSLYTILINHDDQLFANEIKNAFLLMPTPEKFNNHDLSVKIISVDKKVKFNDNKKRKQLILDYRTSSSDMNEVDRFLVNNQIASRLVGKWFNRNWETGVCDMELVKARGLYNASEFDRIIASNSARGSALLQDAGDDLIGNTFVTVNDIRYIDKEKKGKIAGKIISALGVVASAYTGMSAVSDLADQLQDVAESLKGFKVKITTYLYRLVWDEESSENFYQLHYASSPEETTKREAFNDCRGHYKLQYVGMTESSGSTTSFLGVNLEEPIFMVRKACQRALDENIVDLQRAYDEFKVKMPLLSVSPLTAYVGKKEGVDEKTKFEVLEKEEDKDGRVRYKRVGVIQPEKHKIWDNRYMAVEEGAEGATLGFTTFKKVSGGNFAAGMLIREIK